MKIRILRQDLQWLLQKAVPAAAAKSPISVITNCLFCVELNNSHNQISVSATNLSTEVVARLNDVVIPIDDDLSISESFLVPAKKILALCKSLYNNTTIEISSAGKKCTLKADKSRFVLPCSPVVDYPSMANFNTTVSADILIKLDRSAFATYLKRSMFAAGKKDIRQILNGVNFSLKDKEMSNCLRIVATDGHRLALNTAEMLEKVGVDESIESIDALIHRDSAKLLERHLRDLINSDVSPETVKTLNLRVDQKQKMIVVSLREKSERSCESFELEIKMKMLEGVYPNFLQVIPSRNDVGDKIALIDQELFLSAVKRVSSVFDDDFKRLTLDFALGRRAECRISLADKDGSEATETIDLLDGIKTEFTCRVNARYLIDALSAISAGEVIVGATDNKCIIKNSDRDQDVQLIMQQIN